MKPREALLTIWMFGMFLSAVTVIVLAIDAVLHHLGVWGR
jgi:hypothetical protein